MRLSTVTLTGITARPSLIEDIDFLVGTDSSNYPLADKLRNINLWYYNVVSDILQYNSNWEWDDTNKTDFPIGTTNLVAGQLDYSLPSDFLKILRVEVKGSNGYYQQLDQFDEQQIKDIGLTAFMSTNGMPTGYREVGNSIEIYPQASATATTLTAGLKIYYQRNQTEFTNADAAVSPGFAAPFHRILSLGAAFDYTDDPREQAKLKSQIDEMRIALRAHYSSRNREVRPKITPRVRNFE